MAKFAAPALIALFVSAIHIQTLIAQPVDRSRVLAPGNPPLTETMVNKSLDLAEWALRMTLSREERSQVQEFFTNSWKRGDKNGVIEAVEMYDLISQMPAASKESARGKLRDLMLQNLNGDPNGRMNQIFLSAYNRAKNLPANSASLPSLQGSNAVAWDFSGPAALTDTQARSVLDSFARPVEANKTQPLTFDQALNNARRFLNAHASRAAMDAFNASPHARDASRADSAAAGALVYGRPLAALAALLRANELQPQNKARLIRLASVLSYLGMPHEALATLNSPMITDDRAAVSQSAALNARGYSLLQLGKAEEAEKALRQA